MSNPIVTIEMEDGGIIRAELYPEIAPNTVRNFVSLVKKGFYDGVIFHRVIPGLMIQGGDPTGTGMGGPGYSIEGDIQTSAGRCRKACPAKERQASPEEVVQCPARRFLPLYAQRRVYGCRAR